MKFTAIAITTAMLASSVIAIPAANPEAVAEAEAKVRRPNNWCIAPGQMCYKNKRSAEAAAAPAPAPEARRPRRPNNWCIAPGQMCYKHKRDLDSAKAALATDGKHEAAYVFDTDVTDADDVDDEFDGGADEEAIPPVSAPTATA